MAWPVILDRVQSRAHLEALDPDVVVEEMLAAVPSASSVAEYEARDAWIAGAARAIDAMISRAMRILLDHALESDTSIAIPARKVFASTIANYANKLPLLAERARDIAARGGAANPDDIAERVVGAAQSTLALREALFQNVLGVIADLADATAPIADRNARDRNRGERERLQWSALRRDCEVLVREPHQALVAPLAERLARFPEQLDEPAPEREPTLAELIELD
jgi:hypothetical protein